MLRLRDISHTYRPRRGSAVAALRGVSFEARLGEVTTVIGPNGSGKSTLFRLVTGGLDLQQGAITLDDAPLQRARCGVVFQSPALDDRLTVFENLAHHAMLYGRRLKRGEMHTSLLDVLDLRDRLETRVNSLSGGFQRRVELAKALLTDPECLVLDEPFNGLDVNVRDGFSAVLQHVTATRGLVTLLITHDLAVATRSDHVVLLEDGAVIADARPAELLADFGRTVVVIRTDMLQEVEHQVHAQSGLRTLRIAENALLLRDTSLQEVLAIIDERDARIEDIEARRPTIEDYFIAKTGHALQGSGQELMAA